MDSSTALDDSAASALSFAMPDDANSWKVYLLECADGTYYCGVAKHLDRRLAQHNGQLTGGAKYTRSRRPVKLLAFCICENKQNAYRLEYAVKAAPRGKKLDVLLGMRRKNR